MSEPITMQIHPTVFEKSHQKQKCQARGGKKKEMSEDH